MSIGAPGRYFFACGSKDPSAHLWCNRAFGEGLEEHRRRKDTSNGVSPPKEGFGTDRGAVRQPNLRLKIDFEFIFDERPPELDIELTSRLCFCTEYREEKGLGTPPVAFCLIERKVGARDQLIGVRAIGGLALEVGSLPSCGVSSLFMWLVCVES